MRKVWLAIFTWLIFLLLFSGVTLASKAAEQQPGTVVENDSSPQEEQNARRARLLEQRASAIGRCGPPMLDLSEEALEPQAD